VRLLRVLETGEFIRVGSSKAQKTDVRVVAATNVNISEAIKHKKFREDLYYRLNTVPIVVPALRDRAEDIELLFRKFAQDFSERYRMPPIRLTPESLDVLNTYHWPGNIRQLKNIAEQISVIEQDRLIPADKLRMYLPSHEGANLPAIYQTGEEKSFASEREILYKILFDMKKDMTDLKKLVREIMQKGVEHVDFQSDNATLIKNLYHEAESVDDLAMPQQPSLPPKSSEDMHIQDTEEIVEESLSLEAKEIELIQKALGKHNGKRKYAAEELGISERTLYRKIKEYDING